MMNDSSFSEKLFRQFKSLSIRIEKRDDEYGFNYNGSHYCIHVVDAVGAFFIYRKMVLHLVYNAHDNVIHHCSQVPQEQFFWTLNHYKEKGINGYWRSTGSFVYTDLVFLDDELSIKEVISELLVKIESVYNSMQHNLTHYIME